VRAVPEAERDGTLLSRHASRLRAHPRGREAGTHVICDQCGKPDASSITIRAGARKSFTTPVTASRMTSSAPGRVRSIQTIRCWYWPKDLHGAAYIHRVQGRAR
jgi:hypothetical protein